jgi:hypothetical protein
MRARAKSLKRPPTAQVGLTRTPDACLGFFAVRVNPLTAGHPKLPCRSIAIFALVAREARQRTAIRPVRRANRLCGIAQSASARLAGLRSIAAETTCVKKLTLRAVSIESPLPAHARKMFRLQISENHYRPPPVPTHCRGAPRPSRTLKLDAMDAIGDARRASPARTAKSCCPGLPTRANPSEGGPALAEHPTDCV